MLHHWSRLARAKTLLDALVRPGAVPLSAWLALPNAGNVPVRAVAQRWLSSWGLDLATVPDDRDNRNLASYRPSEFRRSPTLDVREVAQFVEELWTLFEPEEADRFPAVERALLRNAWRRWSSGPPTAPDIEGLGLTSMQAAKWVEFLTMPTDSLVLTLADQHSEVGDPRCHLQIISRAALMLFLATSATRRLLATTSCTKETVAFWWQRHGEERGLWGSAGCPTDPRDLWADVVLALESSKAWREGPLSGPALRDWRQAQGSGVEGFGGVELIGIWGLVP